MQIIDLSPQHLPLYLSCLEPWSDEMAEAGDHKARWYARHRDRGLVVKLALDDDGEVVGMIQSLPVEESWVQGEALDFVLCTWVHGHSEGVGNRQGHGLGSALLAALEADARTRGRLGMCAWGLAIPVWMKASWYRKQGYKPVDRDGVAVLLFKPFSAAAQEPRWAKASRKPPRTEGRVGATCFVNGWCPASNIAHERMVRVCAGFPADQVHLERVDTDDPQTRAEWGQVDAIFVDGHELRTGPPPTEAALRRQVERALRLRRWRSRLGLAV